MSGPQSCSILIVDDNPANIDLLAEMLHNQGYIAQTALSGKRAIQLAVSTPPDLILLDVQMPEMNGYEVCQRLKAIERLSAIPVIFLSALGETLDKVKAFAVGGVDYVTKPFEFEEVRARVDTHLENHRLRISLERHNANLQELVEEQVTELIASHRATILALAKLAESRDDDTGNHIRRVQSYCKLLAKQLNRQPEIEGRISIAYIDNVFHTAPLHDIGKVGIPDSILLKPGPLSPAEFNVMKTHTIIGANTLNEVLSSYPDNPFVAMGIKIARSHHERWDGTGYPDGLNGRDIPLPARILAIADQYDALRSSRPYKPPFDHIRTCEIIIEGDGRTKPEHFDPSILRTFSDCRSEFEALFHKFGEV